MKRFLFCLVVLLFASTAMAGAPYGCFSKIFTGNVTSYTELPLKNFVMTYSILTSADDSVTLTIYDTNQVQLDSITTTSATSGELGKFTGYPLMSGKLYYKISDFAGGGTMKVEICGSNQ